MPLSDHGDKTAIALPLFSFTVVIIRDVQTYKWIDGSASFCEHLQTDADANVNCTYAMNANCKFQFLLESYIFGTLLAMCSVMLRIT